ncbi:trafficking protein particle complex subunit 3-like isoform X1 [Huso huso]|uniref:Trafficking protein particle complex subunit n=1 Tax=Huso huso TaxID=61971 RepID=A0ABR0ZX57_HUSHU
MSRQIRKSGIHAIDWHLPALSSSGSAHHISTELFVLTYGALVSDLCKEYSNDEEINHRLETMGYNIGVRLIEDFLARSCVEKCQSYQETTDVIAKVAFKIYLGVTPSVTSSSPAGDEFSLLLDSNPLEDFIEELPEGHSSLLYSNLLCGILRGALQTVRLAAHVELIQNGGKGEKKTEIRLSFLGRLEENLPKSED